jgi:hypothetical protein
LQESLKSFIRNTFGWNGSNARHKWSLYDRYGETTEKEALRQAVGDARLFIARAESEGLEECAVVSQSAALLDAVKATFEPIKARYELWILSGDAVWQFDRWLDTCLDFVREDPWISSANKSQLESTLKKAKQDIGRSQMEQNPFSLTSPPRTTADQVDDRRRPIEAEITAILGSCLPLPASRIKLHR